MPPPTPEQEPRPIEEQADEPTTARGFMRQMNDLQRQARHSMNPEMAWRMVEERVYTSKAKKAMPPKDAPKLTPELEHQLFEARDKLERELNDRVLRSMPPNQGRREQQYLEQARKHKRDTMTPLELVHSEVPVCLDHIGRRRLLEVVHTIRMPEIRGDDETAPLQLFCSRCNMETPVHFAFFCSGHVWCALHVPDLTTCNACNRLTEDCKPVKTYDNRTIMACHNCLTRRVHCQGCERNIGPEYVETAQCGTCMDRGNTHAGPERTFSRGVKWIGKKEGEVMKSKRVFSCEIEGFTKNPNWPMVMYKALPKEVGISQDGSLRNNEGLYGFELQTPKLAGAKGEELVRHMTGAVKNIDAFVNDMTGMHVHLDGAGIIGPSRREYPAALLKLWRTYIVFEDVIMSFLPFSRRRNDYCRPMSEAFKVNDLDIIESLAEAERFWYKERTYSDIVNAKGHQYHASRYFGANFHSLLAHGHFEVRFHSGTLQPNKILQWANLHALIMDAAASEKMDVAFFREAQATYKLSDKTELLFNEIGLAQASRQYFRARQNKFGAKSNEDEETRKSSSPRQQNAPRITIPEPQLRQMAADSNSSRMFYFTGDLQTGAVISGNPISATGVVPNGLIVDEVTTAPQADDFSGMDTDRLWLEYDRELNRGGGNPERLRAIERLIRAREDAEMEEDELSDEL